ncbi:MAG: sigma-70 family RNA polymerase sigma factor [Verrucomicrobiales bacterium]|nr:sigma-70 family RNA polymerase sigma factor [Verrucomicrobiales bacterium]
MSGQAFSNDFEFGAARSPTFATTHWSVVLAVGGQEPERQRAALEALCRSYWYPLYAFVRRQGYSLEEAQDLTQEFFTRVLEKGSLALADQQRGRFRTFLLTALKNFLVNEWQKAHTIRRGGTRTFLSWEQENAEARLQLEPSDDLTPEKAYEKRWAMALLEDVLRQLRSEALDADRAALFEKLKDYLWGEASQTTYAGIGTELGMTETAVKVAAHRLRQRFREVLRAEIAHTVASLEEIDDELRHLFAVVST